MHHAGMALHRACSCILPTQVAGTIEEGGTQKVTYKVAAWTHMNPYEVLAQFNPEKWVAWTQVVFVGPGLSVADFVYVFVSRSDPACATQRGGGICRPNARELRDSQKK